MKNTLRKGTVLLLSGAITLAQFTSAFADEAVTVVQYESTEQENDTQETMGDQPQEPGVGDFTGSPGEPGGQMPDGQPPEKPDGQMPGVSGQMGESAPGGKQEKQEGMLGSWYMGGTDASTAEGDDYAYDSALYVTSDGIDEEKSSKDRIEGGSYDGTGAEGISISDDASGHNGILVYGTSYAITDATIDLATDADGTDTCDFSGKGTAVLLTEQCIPDVF